MAEPVVETPERNLRKVPDAPKETLCSEDDLKRALLGAYVRNSEMTLIARRGRKALKGRNTEQGGIVVPPLGRQRS